MIFGNQEPMNVHSILELEPVDIQSILELEDVDKALFTNDVTLFW